MGKQIMYVCMGAWFLSMAWWIYNYKTMGPIVEFKYQTIGEGNKFEGGCAGAC